MTTTGLLTFDKTVQATHMWLNDLAAELSVDNKQSAFQLLRVTLHALRDRLSVEQASKLAAQLPVLLAGFYYQDWRPATIPNRDRTKADFLTHLDSQIDFDNFDFNSEQAARAVFRVISRRISSGEVDDVKSMLPKHIKELWPTAISV